MNKQWERGPLPLLNINPWQEVMMKFFLLLASRMGMLAVLLLSGVQASASVVIGSTRVIYASDAKEVSVRITNGGQSPVLLQSWIDEGNREAKPADLNVPFVLTPPINRVEANKGQTLRISRLDSSLPMDRESVFWLNVLEIPAKATQLAGENQLQMAFRTRIKLFYRPVGLVGHANDAAKALQWQRQGQKLAAVNPTPYYVNLVSLTMNGKVVDGDMVEPYGSRLFNAPGKQGHQLSVSFVDDYGAINQFETIIK